MFKKLPISFKILIVLNSLISLSSFAALFFYEFNNVVSDNGVSVEPLKLIYTISLMLGVIMILILLYTKKIAVIFETLYGIMTIVDSIGDNSIQIVIGLIILLLIYNKGVLTYVGFIKQEQKQKKVRKKKK